MGFVVSVLLLRQFSLLLPLFGAVDVYIDDREGMPGVAVSQRVCETVMAVSTFLAMWSFKCLLPLMTRSIRAEDIDPERISAMERRHMEHVKKTSKTWQPWQPWQPWHVQHMCSTEHDPYGSLWPMAPHGISSRIFRISLGSFLLVIPNPCGKLWLCVPWTSWRFRFDSEWLHVSLVSSMASVNGFRVGFREVRASSDGCCQAARYADTTNCHSQLVLRDSWWLGDAKALLCDHHHRLEWKGWGHTYFYQILSLTVVLQISFCQVTTSLIYCRQEVAVFPSNLFLSVS